MEAWLNLRGRTKINLKGSNTNCLNYDMKHGCHIEENRTSATSRIGM